MATDSAKYLATLHKNIDKYFNFAEVRNLCFEMGVDYENIPGNMKSAFIRNLIVSLARKGQLQEMVDLLRMQRPHVPWENVPADFSLPESVASEDLQQVVQHNYYGDVVHGNKYGGDHVEGDKFTGDKVAGNKVGGDSYQIGDMIGVEGAAFGAGSSATVQKTTIAPAPVETQATPPSTAATDPQIERLIKRLKMNLEFASPEHKPSANDLITSIDIVLEVAAANPKNDLHLKLLGLGQQQIAAELRTDIPGIEAMLAGSMTASWSGGWNSRICMGIVVLVSILGGLGVSAASLSS